MCLENSFKNVVPNIAGSVAPVPPSAITAPSIIVGLEEDPTIVEVVPIILATRPANCVILPIGAEVVTPATPRTELMSMSPVGNI